MGCIWVGGGQPGRRLGPDEVLYVTSGALGRPGALLELQELLDRVEEEDELVDRVGGPAARPGKKDPDRPVDDQEAGPASWPGHRWLAATGQDEADGCEDGSEASGATDDAEEDGASEHGWSTSSEAWNYSLESSPLASFAFVPPPVHSDEDDSSLPDIDIPVEAPRRAMRPFGGSRPKHRRAPSPLQEAEAAAGSRPKHKKAPPPLQETEAVGGSSPSSLVSQPLLPVEEVESSAAVPVPKTARGSPSWNGYALPSARSGHSSKPRREGTTASTGSWEKGASSSSARGSARGQGPLASSREGRAGCSSVDFQSLNQLSGTPRVLIPAPGPTPRPEPKSARREEPAQSSSRASDKGRGEMTGRAPEAPVFLNGIPQGSYAYSVQAAELRISMMKAPSIAKTQVIEFSPSGKPMLPPLALHLIRSDGVIAPGTYDGETGAASTDSGELSSSGIGSDEDDREPRTRPGMELKATSTGSRTPRTPRTPRAGSARGRRCSATPRTLPTPRTSTRQRSGSIAPSQKSSGRSNAPPMQTRSGSLTPKALISTSGLATSSRENLDPEDVSLEVLSAWLTELEAGERRMRASLEAQHSGNLDSAGVRERMVKSKSQPAKPVNSWVEPWNSDISETPEASRRRRHRKLKFEQEAAGWQAKTSPDPRKARCPFSPSNARPAGIAKLLGCFAK